MTGFGRAEGIVAEKKVTVEVRSLNSKQLDLFIKLPGLYREKDAELRQWAGEEVVRGKSEIVVNSELAPGVKRSHFDALLVREYYLELRSILNNVDKDAKTDLMQVVLRLPDVQNTGREDLTDLEWTGVQKLIHDAMRAFNAFREAEGRKLNDDLRQRVEHISALLVEIDGQDSGRAERTRERIRSRLAELQAKVDQDRFEQELVFYLEKMDINEEKVRLRAHCTYFLETLENEQQQGRKLGFITQEMGREINTLGSKANDAAMQRNVVLMKDELEKIKEQVLNVL